MKIGILWDLDGTLLDTLEDLQDGEREYDVDVLVLYDTATAPATIAARVDALTSAGKSVSAQRTVPPKLRYRELCDMREEK